MSRTMIFVLLGIFAVILVFGYSAVIPTHNSPRSVPTDTPRPAAGGGEDGGGTVAVGQAIYDAQCSACHTTDGSSGIGPTWSGLYESQVTLDDGSAVTADDAYITESILQPAAKVVEGFQPIMPVFELSDAEVDGLIAFIKTLQ